MDRGVTPPKSLFLRQLVRELVTPSSTLESQFSHARVGAIEILEMFRRLDDIVERSLPEQAPIQNVRDQVQRLPQPVVPEVNLDQVKPEYRPALADADLMVALSKFKNSTSRLKQPHQHSKPSTRQGFSIERPPEVETDLKPTWRNHWHPEAASILVSKFRSQHAKKDP